MIVMFPVEHAFQHFSGLLFLGMMIVNYSCWLYVFEMLMRQNASRLLNSAPSCACYCWDLLGGHVSQGGHRFATCWSALH